MQFYHTAGARRTEGLYLPAEIFPQARPQPRKIFSSLPHAALISSRQKLRQPDNGGVKQRRFNYLMHDGIFSFS